MPLYRGHVEISSGSLFLGHAEIEDGYQEVTKFYENDPNVTVTLNVIDNITGGNQYTVAGDLTGATSTGLPGQSYAFNTTVTADAGYYFTTGPTINNASGTYSTSQTVDTTLAGNVSQIPPNQCVATAVETWSGSGPGNVLSFSTTPSSVSRACPNTLQGSSDFTTTATITDSNYQFTSGPSFSYPTNTINTSQNVSIIVTGTVALKTGSTTLEVTDNIIKQNSSDYTLVCNTNSPAGSTNIKNANPLNGPTVNQSGNYTGQYEYAIVPGIPANDYDWQWSNSPSYNWNSAGATSTATLNGTFGSSTPATQTLVVAGVLVAGKGRTKCTITDNISAPAGAVTWQIQYKIGAGGAWINYSSSSPWLDYSTAGTQFVWQAVITLNAGFTWTQQGSSSFSPGSSTTIVLGADAITAVTLSGSAIASMTSFTSSTTSRASCALACADNATMLYYHDDASGMGGVEPSVGDYVYTNAAGGSGNALGNGWYRSGLANFSKYAYHVAGGGGLVDIVKGPGSTCGGC